MPATRKTSSNAIKKTKAPSPIQKRKNRVIDKHLKEIIIEKFFDDDLSKAQVAKLIKLNWSTVDGIIERYVERGTLENLPRRGRKEKLVKLREEHSEFLDEILDEDCQLT
ncbi:hypothetical protein BD408DRAFT_32057 [Parasitella parasitica]|nr:hypothetical protein BD408DRAFT_32057 [Parasitella parasitica]